MMPAARARLDRRVPRAAGLVLTVLWLSAGAPSLAPVALAAPASTSLQRSILTGSGGGRSFGPPAAQPYLLAWTADVGSRFFRLRDVQETGGVAVDSRSGWVYVATRDGRVVCLDAGTTRWSTTIGSGSLAAPAVHRDDVVVGSVDGVLSVLNKVTGELRTRAILAEELVTTPVVVDSPRGARAYVGSSADSLFAVDLRAGQKLWRAHRDLPTGFTITGFARPALGDGVVFAGFADGTVEALEAETGAVRWERALAQGPTLVDVGAVAFDGRTLYATSYSGGLFALDPADGGVRWRQPLTGASFLRLDGPTVYVTAPGVLVASLAATGAPIWRFRYGDQQIASAPELGPALLALTVGGEALYLLDRATGAPAGVFSTGEGVGLPPAISGRAMYVLSSGGRAYALGLTK